MGNSEVGHTAIGAGRTINQELVRISKSIQNADFFKNETLNRIYEITIKNKIQLHLLGLCSSGGVHSYIDNLIALISISKKYKNCIYIISDGSDTAPRSIKKFITIISAYIKNSPNISICTISGRYYSMDRDCRWQRTAKAYNCLINNKIEERYSNNILKVIEDSYQNNIYDEFI